MASDINNILMVWISAVASLAYCRAIAKFMPAGFLRLMAVLPVISLFLIIPLQIKTMHIRGPTSFFLAWLANFKLLLFVFGQGPLSTHPPLSLPRFIAVACLPIKIIDQAPNLKPTHDPNSKTKQNPPPEIAEKDRKSQLNYAWKLLALSVFVYIYTKEQYFPRKFILLLYLVHVYIVLEMMLEIIAAFGRAVLGVELEPQFKEPYLSSSLQDFWSRRWNLIVTGVLHPTVYAPVRSISAPLVGKGRAQFTAMMATFLVSGVMHEVMFYHLGGAKPTGEMTCFFLLHGFCVGMEVSLKRRVKNSSYYYNKVGKVVAELPRMVTGPVVVAFVLATALWLFMPTVLRSRVDVVAYQETLEYYHFVKGIYSPMRKQWFSLAS
ncbi:hypothetical protein Tsubulata_030020 [Turnera subulata]|uniref:Wax synthase domain-containing protein n=1 Tax=Turnera subulata TaxID=218843 RepID=A0A9Q0J366_9ROSI|nr:hypothetical protein Tsubulata_030020 [Turnera subulata]